MASHPKLEDLRLSLGFKKRAAIVAELTGFEPDNVILEFIWLDLTNCNVIG